MKSSHAIGYHAFELAYLAHLYTRAYVAAGGGSDNSFCLYFKICSIKQQTVDQRPARLHAAGPRADRVGPRQWHRCDGRAGSGQSRRIPDPDGCDDPRPDERDGRTRRRVPRDTRSRRKQQCPFRRLRWPDSRSPARRSPCSSRASTSRARSRSIRNASPATARPSIWCRVCGASRSSAFTAPSSLASVDPVEWLEVTKDLDAVNPDDYAAVIAAANYTTVRLRWIASGTITTGNAAEVARNAPAARFFRRAMENPKIIKGAPATRCGC